MGKIVVYRLDIIKRVALFGLIGFVVLIGFTIRWHYVYLGYKFNGRVDSIKYGEKGSAIVIIKSNEYILDGPWTYSPNDKFFIQKGDSMVKVQGSIQVKLIRPNGFTITQ